ncbi:MAG: decarboxylating NADP(+)-dependent phosphogluconate dehydrogenase [Anaerolineales bacterium]|nr:decarboxylating NADP(+)-dependent phosphogluconate dehydrogenase [Anaerolineales bacterium]
MRLEPPEVIMENKADIGLIGLAVMGQNLVLNMNDKGYKVAVFNRTTSKVDVFMEGEAKGRNIIGTHSLEEFVGSLKSPRKIMIMVKAGWPVDATIEQLLPLLDKGDIIIDGGNSHFSDSTRRMNELKDKGIRFVGSGVSGGEIGARLGPSIMPGGNEEAWPYIKPIFQDIAAKVSDGSPCCEWLGPEGAGHFVKMVHNGIEYGDMQMICEAYDLMKTGLKLSNAEISQVFAEWNRGKLDSYLIEITKDILAYQDESGNYVVDQILDTAGQKGTGKWTATAALDAGAPLTLIGEAVFARFLSALKEERVVASRHLWSRTPAFDGDKKSFINAIRDALYASKIVSYAQGYMLLKSAADEYGWDLDYGTIAMMWREGCIIRAVFLEKIKAAYDRKADLPNLLLDDYFNKEVQQAIPGWRKVISKAVEMGIPVPAMASALEFYDGIRRDRLPANLLQAQRDYFGAHTYERVDRPRGEFFHTDWTGEGGDVTASTYDA